MKLKEVSWTVLTLDVCLGYGVPNWVKNGAHQTLANQGASSRFVIEAIFKPLVPKSKQVYKLYI